MTEREALKLAANINPFGSVENARARDAAIEALAQPEQEPVAWMQPDEVHISLWKDDFHTIPLYTAPPQRTWVGLTPQERDEINEQVYGAVPHHVAFHAAIEAKLKQKNGYAEEKNT